MKYTERDIEKAIRLRSEGYNWIATNKNGRPFAYGRMPYRCADDDNDRNEYNIWDNQSGTPWRMLSKEDFKSITWENEPVYVDEIIAEGEEQVNEDIEIARLTAENAELKKRLENAVELPCIEPMTTWDWDDTTGLGKTNFGKYWKVLYRDKDGEFIAYIGATKEEAEAKLAELKGEQK